MKLFTCSVRITTLSTHTFWSPKITKEVFSQEIVNPLQVKPEIIWNVTQGLRLKKDKEIDHKARALEMLNGKNASRRPNPVSDLIADVDSFFEEHQILFSPTVLLPPFDINLRYVAPRLSPT